VSQTYFRIQSSDLIGEMSFKTTGKSW